MADEFLRSKLYEYGANSNLVLEADRDSRSRADEGKGEVESLRGKLDHVRMGDRASNVSKPELSERIDKVRNKRKRMEVSEETKQAKKVGSNIFVASKGATILSQSQQLDSISYRPKTRDTREAYEDLLRLVQTVIGDQPQEILKGATDEILAILKDENARDTAKQKELTSIAPELSVEKFHMILTVSKRITDFNVQEEDEDEQAAAADEEMAVVFDDDGEEDGNEVDELKEDDEEDDEGRDGGDEAVARGLLRGDDAHMAGEVDGEIDGCDLPVHDIDAHWLQRQLSKFYPDANTSSKLAEDTLMALRVTDERICENKLVVLLDFDKFEFIKLLMKNRSKIFYCTRLKQAQSEEERQAVENEMRSDAKGDGLRLLEQLQQKASAESWAQDRMGEFASKARREARSLNKDRLDDGEDHGYGTGITSEKGQSDLLAPLVAAPIDLSDVAFSGGGHFMANTRCELPEKSWRAQKKGYEEVHVPALRPVIPASERLVEVDDLPDWIQPAFAGIRALNRVQSRMFEAAFRNSDNLLLCAPTGAGKTNVALMCMLHQLDLCRGDDGRVNLEAFKIVYVAPMKALVQEVVLTFGKKLAPFGVTVKELSGDQNLTRQQIHETQVIVTTPEKWDIITRKSGERTYTQLVRLIIIDEIHLLHDDRGPVLESLVARTVRQVESTQEAVRLVGLSATLPNYGDVATFLRVDADKGLFFFDNSYRPVPLQQQYIGVTEKKALKRFQLMNEICYEKILQQAGKNQVLIFTHSRAETAKTAKALRDMAVDNDTVGRFVREDSASLEILKVEAASAKNPDLKDLLPYGFAIHHAGMVRSDRSLVEDLFADKHVQVLVSTATLAWGVNLPCHTVIIKGTQMYSPEEGRWTELSPLDIMQMLGRAGRYGLDSEGEGIIITAHSELQYYLSLMNQQLPIESQFVKKLPDMLNAEIVLGSLSTVKEAAEWLGYTYLYVRMLRNPRMYGISEDTSSDDTTLLRRRIELVHAAASVLDKDGLIKYDRRMGGFQATALGRISSHYYVAHDSMGTFNENLKPSLGDIEIFRLFSLSSEFKQMHVREEEKLELAKLVQRVPVPVKESVEEASAKVNVLLQAYISRLKLEGFALVADMAFIQQSACRIMRALFEMAMVRGWAALTSKLLNICKLTERRIWASQSPLRQFGNIPDIIIRKLEKNSDILWERYFELKPQDLGEMVKIPKMGKTLFKFVHMFPRMTLNAHILPITRSLLRIDLSISPDFDFDAQVLDSNLLFWILVEDVDGEHILHHEPFLLQARNKNEEHIINFTVPMLDPAPPQYFIKLVSDRWLHSETVLPISFRHLILPQKFPPPSELLDLQPLPVSAFKNDVLQGLYSSFSHFNPIQTQSFSTLFQTEENALICAPTGSGKTVCAEFAILKLFASNLSGAKCVYIAPKEETATAIFHDWNKRLGVALNATVVLLSGDSATDVNLLNLGDIIVSSVANWDMVSRRWKQRKAIQSVSLYVFDELQLLGGADGATLEIVVSRARFIASQLERSMRVVALATSLANAKDIGDWIGASSQSVFNFGPDVRPVPLDMQFMSFETNHFSSRILSMVKPMFGAIAKSAGEKPVIVFVPSRRQAQLTAIDLLAFTTARGEPNAFLRQTSSDAMRRALEGVTDPTARQTMSQGVGFVHAGMTSLERECIQGLLRENVIQVLVVPHNLCWAVNAAAAYMVLIMDTVYYEGREHRYVDYSITDLLQMIGKASRQGQDQSSKCIIMHHAPKGAYLKKLLREPLPIESHLDHFLHDHLNAEIVTRTVENKPDAVDYLTWTFYYRRLTQNPNYYNLQGTTHRHLSDHLSELVENVIGELEESRCIAVEDEVELSPLNLGMIASHYYIEYTTVELFASSVSAKMKTRGVLEILAAASEFAQLSMRKDESSQLKKIAQHQPYAIRVGASWEDPSTKAFVLIQAHLSRFNLNNELALDLTTILNHCIKLLQALVDVISSQGWLKPALATMEMSQMAVQGLWEKDSPLLQVPHFTLPLIETLRDNASVVSVFDLLDMDDDLRAKLLDFAPAQMSDIAMFCNAYPSVEVQYELSMTGDITAGDAIALRVVLRRDADEDEEEEHDLGTLGNVVCPRYPSQKRESWWLVLGNTADNGLLSIKRVSLAREAKVKLEFLAPDVPGDYNFTLYVMCDSYLGCDQEYNLNLSIVPAIIDSEGGESLNDA